MERAPVYWTILTRRSAFYSRIRNEYANQRNFYALAYDQAEVIDAVGQVCFVRLGLLTRFKGMRGNDARFINHGCDPNLEVRKFQTLGDGMEEYEVGMWASRDIQQGEEVTPVASIEVPLIQVHSYFTITISRTSAHQARMCARSVDAAHRTA